MYKLVEAYTEELKTAECDCKPHVSLISGGDEITIVGTITRNKCGSILIKCTTCPCCKYDYQNCLKDINSEEQTSIVTPGSDLWELEGEVNKGGSMPSGKEMVVTSSGLPAADLWEAKGEVNREAVCKTTSGGEATTASGMKSSTELQVERLVVRKGIVWKVTEEDIVHLLAVTKFHLIISRLLMVYLILGAGVIIITSFTYTICKFGKSFITSIWYEVKCVYRMGLISFIT